MQRASFPRMLSRPRLKVHNMILMNVYLFPTVSIADNSVRHSLHANVLFK